MCTAISGMKFQLPFWDGLWIVQATRSFVAKDLGFSVCPAYFPWRRSAPVSVLTSTWPSRRVWQCGVIGTDGCNIIDQINLADIVNRELSGGCVVLCFYRDYDNNDLENIISNMRLKAPTLRRSLDHIYRT